MESGTLVYAVQLDGYQAAALQERLLERDSPFAEQLFHRVRKAWLYRGICTEVVVPLSKRELKLVSKLGCSTRRPGVVNYRYLAIYRNPNYPQEVRLKSVEKPAKKRTFRVAGAGRKKFTRVKLYRIIKPSKESSMAKSQTKKKQNTKSEDEDDIDELEGLEELEELEEPEVDEDDDEEEEAPKKKSKKSKAKASKGKTKTSKKRKTKVEVEVEDEDEEDEDEEEEAPKKSKKAAKGKKGKGKKAEPTAKSKKGAPGKSTKEATGGVGTAELAEAASELAEADITGRDVRVYLRANEVEKDPEHGRYVWPSVNNKEFKKLAKAIAAEYED